MMIFFLFSVHKFPRASKLKSYAELWRKWFDLKSNRKGLNLPIKLRDYWFDKWFDITKKQRFPIISKQIFNYMSGANSLDLHLLFMITESATESNVEMMMNKVDHFAMKTGLKPWHVIVGVLCKYLTTMLEQAFFITFFLGSSCLRCCWLTRLVHLEVFPQKEAQGWKKEERGWQIWRSE